MTSERSSQLIDKIFVQARSLHKFLDKDVSDQTLKDIYELSKWAPTGFNYL